MAQGFVNNSGLSLPLAISQGGTGNTTGTATINANLTGPVTSVGNTTSIANRAITESMLYVTPYGMPYIITRGIY